MKKHGWFETIRAVLREEPETWLAYLHGQKFEALDHVKEAKPRFRGAPVRLAVFFYRLMSKSAFRFAPSRPERHRVLAFAGTANQRDALSNTLEALERRRVSVLAVSAPEANTDGEPTRRYQTLRFGPVEVAKAIWLLMLRVRSVRRQLSSGHDRLTAWRLDTFCWPYVYLAYFERLLRQVQPSVVLVSNDHNAPNRSLLAVARAMGIKTAYMQHASVSPLFPCLTMDYAFLDGKAALECYIQSEANRPPALSLPQRHVFLTGQKKPLVVERKTSEGVIGLALNALDTPSDVAPVLDALTGTGRRLCVRWHPALKGRKLEPFLAVLQGYPYVERSDPNDEPVGRFLGRLDGLVAGNSSIHLEAALSGVVPVYFEFSETRLSDYYGYVRQGLSIAAESLEDLVNAVRLIREGHLSVNADAVRYYSATFKTQWEAAEGELVAGHLDSLLDGADPRTLWGYEALSGDGSEFSAMGKTGTD